MTTNSVGCRTTVLVCITCRASTDPIDTLETSRKGLALADATALALGDADDVEVVRVRCLANCSRGLSAAIRKQNAWTYVFGHLDAERDGPTLIAGARLFAGATDGLMPWRGRPDPLKRGLIARVPPANFGGELPDGPPSSGSVTSNSSAASSGSALSSDSAASSDSAPPNGRPVPT